MKLRAHLARVARQSLLIFTIGTLFFLNGAALRQRFPSDVNSRRSVSEPRVNEMQFYATTVSGLEHILASEIKQLSRAKNIRVEKGGVFFSGDKQTALEGLLWLRTSLRLMQMVTEGRAETKDDLYALCSTVDWTAMIDPSSTIKCDTTVGATTAELSHTHFTSLTVKNAIVDQFRTKTGARPSVDIKDPDLSVLLYLHKGWATLYKVWSGDSSMHKRGYRDVVHVAALRETTAAALVMASEWSPEKQPLCDPMCGSGTIAIEAAFIATNTAPGLIKYGHSQDGMRQLPRSLKWSHTTDAEWDQVWTEADKVDKRKQFIEEKQPVIAVANDIHPGAIEIALRGAEMAGVSSLIDFTCNDIASYSPKISPNFILTNPPWDIRLEGADESWRKLGGFVRAHTPDESSTILWALSGNPEVMKGLEMRPSHHIPIRGAARDMRFIRYDFTQNI
jgi:putative N6-adenine-specific DNA methylase